MKDQANDEFNRAEFFELLEVLVKVAENRLLLEGHPCGARPGSALLRFPFTFPEVEDLCLRSRLFPWLTSAGEWFIDPVTKAPRMNLPQASLSALGQILTKNCRKQIRLRSGRLVMLGLTGRNRHRKYWIHDVPADNGSVAESSAASPRSVRTQPELFARANKDPRR